MSINTAIIGLGIMGRRMLERMSDHDGFCPLAIWDTDPVACRSAQALVPDAQIASDAEAAIAAADLVYIACPPASHKTHALAAARSGKALFLEKPLGVDVGESHALVAQLEAKGVPAAVNFTQAAGSALASVTEAAATGALGDLVGADIVLNYSAWPRAWQMAAEWLRFRAEGGMTREVLSHFLFFTERVLGPLTLVWAHPSYPRDSALCETHLLARLEARDGLPVSVLASVGGIQPDRQEVTIKGQAASRRISDFHVVSASDGGPFIELSERPADTRQDSLNAQLNELLACLDGRPHRLATPAEALRVQRLVEAMLES